MASWFNGTKTERLPMGQLVSLQAGRHFRGARAIMITRLTLTVTLSVK